ncbi:MAG: chorismate-binding protein, partial [Bacteroidetes bacterium]|nr:chorismate-binding protein [Bacteroidota bacterium]
NKRLIGEANNEQLNILKQSEKELAENVMIVDLVRNDLTKVCKTGTIKVEELCGTYAFSKVNQMISTVTGQLQEKESFFEIMQALFPMGSMTGAPKIEVIKNIELFEQTKRGLYSGCVGYIMPNKDFDFNVVIRTLVIEENQIHFHVGGAITFDSEAEKEFEECLLKGNSITDLFEE